MFKDMVYKDKNLYLYKNQNNEKHAIFVTFLTIIEVKTNKL